jgi:hypothetical protein
VTDEASDGKLDALILAFRFLLKRLRVPLLR